MYVYTVITKSRCRLVLEYKVTLHSRNYHDKISSIVIVYPTRIVHFILVSLGIVIGLFLREDKKHITLYERSTNGTNEKSGHCLSLSDQSINTLIILVGNECLRFSVVIFGELLTLEWYLNFSNGVF